MDQSQRRITTFLRPRQARRLRLRPPFRHSSFREQAPTKVNWSNIWTRDEAVMNLDWNRDEVIVVDDPLMFPSTVLTMLLYFNLPSRHGDCPFSHQIVALSLCSRVTGDSKDYTAWWLGDNNYYRARWLGDSIIEHGDWVKTEHCD